MQHTALTLSLDTVIAASPMLGHALEDRARVRDAQDRALLERFQAASTSPLSDAAQEDLFLVSPLDLLVVEGKKGKEFHITEMNGTGIGGLTNMTSDAVAVVLNNLTDFARQLTEPNAVLLVAVSGVESSKNARRNHMVHEKMLYVEALKRGFELAGHRPCVLTMALLENKPEAIQTDQPGVILGYIKEFLNALGLRNNGRLELFGRPVTAGIND